jgi:hypothetical protein
MFLGSSSIISKTEAIIVSDFKPLLNKITPTDDILLPIVQLSLSSFPTLITLPTPNPTSKFNNKKKCSVIQNKDFPKLNYTIDILKNSYKCETDHHDENKEAWKLSPIRSMATSIMVCSLIYIYKNKMY